MELFSISCTTCRSRLTVRDESAIGQILACPKCQSMVLVEPPIGWSGPEHRTASETPPRTESRSKKSRWKDDNQPASTATESTFDDAAALFDDQPPVVQSRTSAEDTSRPSARVGQEANRPQEPQPREPQPRESQARESQHLENKTSASWPGERQSVANSSLTGPREQVPKAAHLPGRAGEPQRPVLPDADWTSSRTRKLRDILMLAMAGVAGLLLSLALFGYIGFRYHVASETTGSDDDYEACGGSASLADADSTGPETLAADAAESHSAGPELEPNGDEVETQYSTVSDQTASTQNDAADRQIDSAVLPAADRNSEEIVEPSEVLAADPPVPQDTASPRDTDPVSSSEGPPDFEPSGVTSGTTPPTDSLLDDLEDFGKYFDDKPFDAADAVGTTDGSASGGSDPVTSIPRPEPREVDLAARLEDSIPAIELRGIALTTFLQVISEMSTIAISIDPDVLLMAHVSPRTAVEVVQTDTTVGKILEAALAPHGLAYVAIGQQLRIVTADADALALRDITYRVDDLATNEEELNGLGDRIISLIAPASWSRSGGAGELYRNEGAFVARQTNAVHAKITLLLEKLRVARGIPNRDSLPSHLLDLTPRVARPGDQLKTLVSMNYFQPTLLVDILKRIERQSGLSILVDWQATSSIGWTTDTKTTLTVDKLPLDQVLSELLSPMELSYLVVDEATLQITTNQALDNRSELEFYNLSSPLAEMDPAAVVQQIRDSLSIDDRSRDVALVIDMPSGFLMARLTQPQHVSLQRLLASWPGR